MSDSPTAHPPQVRRDAPHALTEARRYVREVEARVPCPPPDAPAGAHIEYVKRHVTQPLRESLDEGLFDGDYDDEIEMWHYGSAILDHLEDDLEDPKSLYKVSEAAYGDSGGYVENDDEAIAMVGRVRDLLPRNASGEIVGKMIDRVIKSLERRLELIDDAESAFETIIENLKFGKPLTSDPSMASFLTELMSRLEAERGVAQAMQ